MAEMKYLERCIKEALRLYPPVPFIERVSQDYVKIGNENEFEGETPCL